MKLDSKIPTEGDFSDRWNIHKTKLSLINPKNKKKYKVIVVGTGLAGASASATLAGLGYQVHSFCFQDSPRRAHSIAAQGGINAAKNYQSDGDSVYRLFYDTIKGGDFRSREANVYRLAQESLNIIDQAVAQGVPFARDYGGFLANRSFGGAQVSRTFYARGQTGQQLLIGAYGALQRMIALGAVKMHTRTEMMDIVLKDSKAVGIITRCLVTGKISRHSAHCVVLATGGYGNVFYLSTNAIGCNVSATYRAYKKGALFANPCFTQIHPTCIPVKGDYQSKLTLMSESLRNDGRVWVPKKGIASKDPLKIAEVDRDYYLERIYPSFGNLVPRDIASRKAKEVCDEGRGVGSSGLGVYLDFSDAIKNYGKDTMAARYGNLFAMYEQITGENPYNTPMRIYPAVHYTMGGLWVDYNLMSNIDGLFVIGEANFSDHGANRLGASALMQGLADGYFIVPHTLTDYLAKHKPYAPETSDIVFDTAHEITQKRIDHLLSINGSTSPYEFHRKLGKIMWEYCGMSRSKSGLEQAISQIKELRLRYNSDLCVTGSKDSLNQTLETAGRVGDFLSFAELMCLDALHRNESCGGHFRTEYQTEASEAKRDDENFAHVAAWQDDKTQADNSKDNEFDANPLATKLHKEPLKFDQVQLSTRSYK